MASGERFSGYPAEFGFATADTMDLLQVQATDLQANNTVGQMIPAGAVDPQAYIVARSQPVFNLQTQDLTTILTDVSFIAGKCFDEQSTFALQERSDCGTFEVGSTHSIRTVEKGFMYIDNISVDMNSQDGAIVNLIFVPLKTAGTDLVVTAAGALPSIVPTYTSSFFLASVYHNSVEIPGLQNVTIRSGIQFVPTPSSPGAFDSLGSIITRGAEISFRCEKVDEFDATSIVGAAVNTSFSAYLQKADPTNAAGDGRIAAGTGAHLKIACTAGRIETRSISFEGNDNAGVEVVVSPTGTPTFSIASTIP